MRALENELERMRGREFELEMRRVQSGARPRLPAWAKAALILVVLAAAGGTALLYSVVSTSADLRVREAEQRLERVRERAEQQVETALAVAATARDRLRGAQAAADDLRAELDRREATAEEGNKSGGAATPRPRPRPHRGDATSGPRGRPGPGSGRGASTTGAPTPPREPVELSRDPLDGRVPGLD